MAGRSAPFLDNAVSKVPADSRIERGLSSHSKVGRIREASSTVAAELDNGEFSFTLPLATGA